jgi:hypothetical protein
MSRNFTLNLPSPRRAALIGVIALAAAAALAANISPAAAFGHGGFRSHGGFGGFHNGFHHRFFAFGAPGYLSGYPYDDYGADDGCLRRVWGPYGWHVINVCY